MEPTKTMVYQNLIQKMIIRGLGTDTDTRGQQHMRRNLLQIIQVEVLLENAGWDTDPGARREEFVSLDGEKLSEDLTKFWTLCTDNRNKGIVNLSEHKPVEFDDIYCLASEKEEKRTKKDCQRMCKELPNLAASIPDSHPLKLYFCNQLSEVMKSKNYVKIQELYDLVVEASTFELSSESEFDGED